MEKILVVDDESLVLEVSKEILEQAGFHVLTAFTGEEALEVYKSSEDGIDLVLLDLSMPGMGGPKTLESLLEQDPKVKVLIASGYSPADGGEGLVGLGASGFINKPYRVAELLAKIRAALEN